MASKERANTDKDTEDEMALYRNDHEGRTMAALEDKVRKDPRYAVMAQGIVDKIAEFVKALPADDAAAYAVMAENGGSSKLLTRWVSESGEDFRHGGSMYAHSAHNLLKALAVDLWAIAIMQRNAR